MPIEFETAPEQQQAFIVEITKQIEMHFSAFEGFLSASFHASADGRRVFNYAQWRSRQAWEEALPRGAEIDDATPGTETDEAIRKVIVTYGAKPIRADILRVARVVETSRST